MAKVLTISRNESADSIKKKIKKWNEEGTGNEKIFKAKKFTGKIKSFGDPLEYQRKLRNEWS